MRQLKIIMLSNKMQETNIFFNMKRYNRAKLGKVAIP